MTNLPQSALEVLERVSEDLNRKPIAAGTKTLTVREVRRAMAQAARAASPGQVPPVVFDAGRADALVVMRVADLVTLVDSGAVSEAATGRSARCAPSCTAPSPTTSAAMRS